MVPVLTFDPNLGYLVLSFITWSITFAIVVFGVMLREKILLWDESWRQTVENSGVTLEDYADDLKRSHEKIRRTFRWLGFFTLVFLGLMALVAREGFLEKPLLLQPSVVSALWLLLLVMLSMIVPALVNFGVGAYVAETMLLKANTFVLKDAREEYREKKAKFKIMSRAREIREKREALKATLQPVAPAAPAAAPAAAQ